MVMAMAIKGDGGGDGDGDGINIYIPAYKHIEVEFNQLMYTLLIQEKIANASQCLGTK